MNNVDEYLKKINETPPYSYLGMTGYPDTGSGRYTLSAGYRAWFEINKAQRIYLNYSEHIAQVLISTIIGGLYWPLLTGSISLFYFFMRLGWTWSYDKSPTDRNKRRYGWAV